MSPPMRKLSAVEVRATLDEAGPGATFHLALERPHPRVTEVVQRVEVRGTVAELREVFAPDPGGILNPLPPEPPVGSKVGFSHRPTEVIYERVEGGWVMPEWSEHGGRWRPHSWEYLALTYVGALVLVREADGG